MSLDRAYLLNRHTIPDAISHISDAFKHLSVAPNARIEAAHAAINSEEVLERVSQSSPWVALIRFTISGTDSRTPKTDPNAKWQNTADPKMDRMAVRCYTFHVKLC